MASRVNTKFVLILALTVLFVGGMVGGMLVLRHKGNVQRHVTAGNQHLEAGEHEKALKAFGRALAKEEGNLEYLRKFEEALLQIRPTDREDARAKYLQRLEVLQRAVRYHGADAGHHLRLIEEYMFPARAAGAELFWQRIGEAAEEMWSQTSPDDPRRIDAKLYEGMARFRQVNMLADLELDEPVERLGIAALLKPEDDVLQYLEAHPDSDLGWATLVLGQLAVAEKFRTEGQDVQRAEWMRRAAASVDEAQRRVSEGPEVARIVLLYRGLRWLDEPDAVDVAELDRTMDRALELVSRSGDPILVFETAELLRSIGRDGYLPRSIELLESYLEAHPDARFHRAVLAQHLYVNGQLDEAQASAEALIGAEVLPVSFLSEFRDRLEKRAAAMLVDIAFRRWEMAEDDARPQALADVEQAMDRLDGMVTDVAGDEAYLFAEGKVAFARGDHATAAARFDRLRRGTTRPNVEVLMYAAQSLEETGALGLAYECARRICDLRPHAARFHYEAARLAHDLRLYGDSRRWLDKLFELDPEHGKGRQLASMLQVALRDDDGGQALDPVARAVVEADAAMKSDDPVTAEQTLVAALEQQPGSLQLLDALLQVRLAARKNDEALAVVDELLALQPENTRLRRLKTVLETDDPILAIEQYVETLELDEGGRAVALLMNFSTLASLQRAAAEQAEAAGQSAEAAEARAIAARAEQETARYVGDATRLAPDSLQLLEYNLRRAVADQDWDDAEKLVQRAGALDADQAGGKLYAGQIAAWRGNLEEAAIILTEATDRIPFSAVAWRSLAVVHQRLGNFGRAKEAYARAYECNPNDVQTVRQYVGLLIRVGDEPRALLVLQNARRLVPNSVPVREAWLELEGRVGNRPMVLRLRRELYRQSPGDRVNARALARLLATIDPDRALIQDDAGEPVHTDGTWIRMTTAQKEKLVEAERARWHAECDAIIAAMAEGAESDLDAAILRATLLRERGAIDAGEKVLADFAETRTPPDVEALIALGRFQFAVGRENRGVATIDRARSYQDPAGREADRALAELYFERSEYEKAVAALERAVEPKPDARIELQIIECYAKLKDFEAAQRLLDERMAAGEDGYYEQMLAASIADGQAHELILDGRTAEAEPALARRDAALLEAERLMPFNPEPHVQRALALRRAFNRQIAAVGPRQAVEIRRRSRLLDDALTALSRADEVRQGALETLQARVGVLEARGDVSGAIAELERLVERYPDQTDARARLAGLRYDDDDIGAALETLDDAISRNPTLARWHEMKGDLLLQELRRRLDDSAPAGDLGARAIEAYKQAVRLEADPARVGKLADAYVRLERPDYRAVIDLLQSAHEQLAADPSLRNVLAIALHHLGHTNEAIQQLRLSFAQYKADRSLIPWEAMTTIGYWYRTAREVLQGQPQAVESFVHDLTGNALDPIDLKWLALLWASVDLKRALELHNRSIAEHRGADRQLEAELHYDLARYQLYARDLEAAVAALRRVLELEPDHKLAMNNLAFLLATRLGRVEEAVPVASRLEEVLSHRDSIRSRATYLDTIGWVYHLAGRRDDAEATLRASVELEETASNCLHMGRMFLEQGKVDAAEERMQRAAELGPDPETAAEIERLSDDIRTRKGRNQ